MVSLSSSQHLLVRGNIIPLNNTIVPTAPATPTGLTANSGNQETVVYWTLQANVDNFTLYVNTEDNFLTATAFSESLTGADTEFIHNPGSSFALEPGWRYYYWLVATNGIGSSDPAGSVTARSSVTLANGASATLSVPDNATMNLEDLFFAYSPGPPLPDFFNIIVGLGTYITIDGEWLDSNTEEPAGSTPISGSFSVTNGTGAPFTFWNGEP